MRFFKVAHDILTTPMGVILNLSLSINCFDVAWYAVQAQKKIFQKFSGKLSTDLFIVHPVQIIRKTCKYILNFTRKLITEPPSDFTLNDSTRKQVLYLSHVFNKRLDDRKDIRVIYFEIYIYAMHSTEQTKKMGIVEEPLSWFTDYLSNRKQDVVFNGKKSTGGNINAGVPQGSILVIQRKNETQYHPSIDMNHVHIKKTSILISISGKFSKVMEMGIHINK